MEQTYFFELSGELENMAAAEAVKCIEAETGRSGISGRGPGYLTAVFDDSFLDGIADRIALSHSIGRYLGSCDPANAEELPEIQLPAGTFAIRAKRYGGLMKDVDSQNLVRKIGGILSANNDVDLKHPDIIVRMLMCDKVHLFIEDRAIERDLMEKRKVGERPFFSPISLHPKYARALINLTGVKRGGYVLDPFCGTGGIVIEAAEMGMKAMASDFDEEMTIGCMENLDFYGLKAAKVEVADIRDIPQIFSEIDAVACDPPYGRSTKTGGEKIEHIYKMAMNAIPQVLKDGCRAGVVLPLIYKETPMDFEEVFDQYVHGTLTRHYHIYRK